MNQTDFAAIAGATRQTQSNYEKGERSPDAAYLGAISKAGADTAYILTGVHAAYALPRQDALTHAEPGAAYDAQIQTLAQGPPKAVLYWRELRLLEGFQRLSEADKKMIEAMMTRLTDGREESSRSLE